MNSTNIAERLNGFGPTEIFAAYDLIEGKHGKTPLLYFGTVHHNGVKVDLYAKMDTLNPGGSFKDRGSLYSMHEALRTHSIMPGGKVVTASAGNHAQGVARAARDYSLRAIIFMSNKTPQKKIDGTKALKAEVILVEGDYHDAAKRAMDHSAETGDLYIPAYEHENILLGQSSVVTEAMFQFRDTGIRPDFFVFPYGGGGLANGGGFVSRYFDKTGMFDPNPDSRIFTFGVQARNFNTMVRSFKAGRVVDFEYRGETIADGIRVPNASPQMLELTKRFIDDMFDVTEDEIKDAIRRVYSSDLLSDVMKDAALRERLGFHSNHIQRVDRLNIVEGAAAAAFACVFGNMIDYGAIAETNKKKGLVAVVAASGNNIDQRLLDEILAKTG